MTEKRTFQGVYQELTYKSSQASKLEKELEDLDEEIKTLRIEMMGFKNIK